MNNKTYRELYAIENLPVFQNRMFRSELEAQQCTTGNILLVQDENTGLVYNRDFDINLVEYSKDYQNEQATSQFFQEHLEQVAGIIGRHFANNSLIEIGCGKGHFLKKLQGYGFQITGFDPTYEGVDPSISKSYFSEEVNVKADGLIFRHVLEHIENPVDFCYSMNKINQGGKIYIEVPCLDWIMRNRAWFDIFYEHVNYFRLSDFYRIFSKVYESGHLFGGQYLYVVADLGSIQIPKAKASDILQFPIDFLKTLEEYRLRLKRNSRFSQIAVWGGASKGVIFSLLMQRADVKIDIVIDINPAKQGLYLPSTGYQVYSPREATQSLLPDSEIIVMNSNYLDEIIQMTGNKFRYIAIDQE